MNNILLDELPTEWNGYIVNTWFQVGIQLQMLLEDISVTDEEKYILYIELMFSNDDGTLREYPQGEELFSCLMWYLNGWYHDKASSKEEKKKRTIDYDIDQYRIYADFRSIYNIDLSKENMHYWKFCGLLWNMPYKYSSFLQVVEMRGKEIKADMSKAEKESIKKAQEIYRLDISVKDEYSSEQVSKIDEFDRMMEQFKKK